MTPARRPPAGDGGPVGLRALRRPGRVLGYRPGLTRPEPPKGEQPPLSSAVVFIISNMAAIAIATITVAHLLLAVDEHPFAVRLLTAIPAIVLILEARNFLKNEPGELPFVVIALLQYYGAFCFGVFFDLKFFDLHGPVHFTDEARLQSGFAVAIGAVSIWIGAKIGRRVGSDLGPHFTKLMPRSEVPEEWDKAFYIYASATAFVALLLVFASNIVPPALTQPVFLAFPLELAIGLALAVPPRRLGDRAAQGLVVVTLVVGMLRGMLDYLFRGGIAYVTGRWAAVRTVSLRLVAAVIILFAVIQPLKASYRQQVWGTAARTGQSIGMSDRISAWGNAWDGRFHDDGSRSSNANGAMDRMSELDAVTHAFEVVPRRVDYLGGTGLLPIFYAPIPRFIWPSKPTTRDTVQRYGVTFGRQSEEGALTTAINLPLLVEGYWNLGWPGIILVCAALGLWVGMSQKMFAGSHWAMRATGIANITNLTVAGPIVYVYGSIFQTITSRMAVCWGVFWLAKMLSRREYDVHRPMGARARPAPARPPHAMARGGGAASGGRG